MAKEARRSSLTKSELPSVKVEASPPKLNGSSLRKKEVTPVRYYGYSRDWNKAAGHQGEGTQNSVYNIAIKHGPLLEL